jgi:NADH:ubiquinone oxidoreductase subunit 5 (subunit L)/multisubunit Na+/H+ antiporter MnhA subunit
MLFLTFHGDRPEQKGLKAHPHESEPILVAPVFFLALGAGLVGVFGLGTQIERFVEFGWRRLPGFDKPLDLPGSVEIARLGFMNLFGRGGALALLGFAAAYYLTMVDAGWDWRWRKNSPALEAVFESDFGWKIFVAWLADATVAVARFCGRVLDKRWWDGVIEESAFAARGASETLAGYSVGRLNDYLWWMVAGAALLLGRAFL